LFGGEVLAEAFAHIDKYVMRSGDEEKKDTRRVGGPHIFGKAACEDEM
jgi:hypothetical protein